MSRLLGMVLGGYLVGVAFSLALHGAVGLRPMMRRMGASKAIIGLVLCALWWPWSIARLVLGTEHDEA